MTGWPTATASSMFSSSVLARLSSAAEGEERVLRVPASSATAALARCMWVEGSPDFSAAGACPPGDGTAGDGTAGDGTAGDGTAGDEAPGAATACDEASDPWASDRWASDRASERSALDD